MAKKSIAEVFGDVEVVQVDAIRPASYNPRKVIESRLQLVKLSLSRFGFLLPIYIDAEGEILSGHQRHFVATTMLGARYVPVVRTRRLTKAEARSLNLLFNRATNDMSVLASSEPLSSKLESSDIPKRAAELPIIDANSEEFMPCRHAQLVNVVDVLDRNPVWTDASGVSMTLQLARMGETEIMPIVLTRDSMQIVNGKARARAAAKIGIERIKATFIPEEQLEIASGLLNLLSMKYEVEGALADDLRSNAFRAAPSVRHSMSVNATYELTRHLPPSHYFDPKVPQHGAAWLKHYGPNTLDFGAGNYLDASNAEAMGANAAAFEPYYCWDRVKAQEAAEKWFFSRVEDGRELNSIFLSNVMNTVPFESDRRKVVLIIAALCSDRTKVYSSSRYIGAASSEAAQRGDRTSITSSENSIRIDGEPGVKVTSVQNKPAIQKFHSESDLAQLWNTQFTFVEKESTNAHAFVRCWKPKPVDLVALVEALEFEFNLPWSDGSRFDRVDRAIEVFSKRLGIELNDFRQR